MTVATPATPSIWSSAISSRRQARINSGNAIRIPVATPEDPMSCTRWICRSPVSNQPLTSPIQLKNPMPKIKAKTTAITLNHVRRVFEIATSCETSIAPPSRLGCRRHLSADRAPPLLRSCYGTYISLIQDSDARSEEDAAARSVSSKPISTWRCLGRDDHLAVEGEIGGRIDTFSEHDLSP